MSRQTIALFTVSGALVFACMLLLGSWLSGSEPDQENADIIFAPKTFYVLHDNIVHASGTLLGDELEYPNSTVAFTCDRTRNECLSTSIQQVGRNQLGPLTALDHYAVTRWDGDEIIATRPAGLGCRISTVTFHLKSHSVALRDEPAQQRPPGCEEDPLQTYEWQLGDPSSWTERRSN